jgi:hypothetical protein
MAWKAEHWLEEVFPGKSRIYEEYRLLTSRELAVVAAAVLDLALATLLSRRFIDIASESDAFLGVNGDGRAPAASFGARIQLALLIGVITESDAEILRAIKEIRNLFAHRVHVDFCSPVAQKPLRSLYSRWRKRHEALVSAELIAGSPCGLDEIEKHLGKIPEAGEGLLLAVFTTYHAYFHILSSRVGRIELIR